MSVKKLREIALKADMNNAAVLLGRKGGSAKSEAKSKAARKNWQKALKAIAAARAKKNGTNGEEK